MGRSNVEPPERGALVTGLPEDVAGARVLAAHQTTLFGPGVWFKAALLERCASLGARATFVEVDTAFESALHFRRPAGTDDEPFVAEVPLPAGTFLARVPAPSRGTFARLLDDAEAESPPYLRAVVTPALARAREALPAGAGSLAEAVVAWRRALEGAGRYESVPFTRLDFAPFAEEVVRLGETGAVAYNEATAAFRAAHRVRSAAQPWPDLAVGGGRVELPLWAATGKRRSRVYLRRGRVEDEPGRPVRVGDLLPRALTLTLFLRSRCADLFVHGVGGARYDEVTEAFANAVELGPLCPVVVATASVGLVESAGEAERALEAARRTLSRAPHHPDEFLPPDHALVRAKRALVARFSGRGDRVALHAELASLNERLAREARPAVAELRERARRLEGEARRERTAAFRDYSFPLHDFAALVRLARETQRAR